jgi:hypothetical protein
MADKKQNPSKPEDKPRKKEKPAETVQLTAEDLRKISGGAKLPPTPPVQAQDIRKK